MSKCRQYYWSEESVKVPSGVVENKEDWVWKEGIFKGKVWWLIAL